MIEAQGARCARCAPEAVVADERGVGRAATLTPSAIVVLVRRGETDRVRTMMMTVPVWVLLGFAAWTLLSLIFSVGVHRWSRILTRRAAISDFSTPDAYEGTPLYERAMRAHANCIENLPVYGAVVVAIVAAGVQSPTLDVLALVLLGARVLHTLIHIPFEQTSVVVGIRFTFFLTQVVCMFWMGGYVVAEAA